jgi:hypothetical protein
LLKEKCPWHLDDNHTTEQCYQLRRALKSTPEPPHPHDKKGKKKNERGNDDFQEPDKTVNVLFSGLPSRREQKATRREVLSIEPAVPTPLRWSEVPITFSRADQWTSFSEPGWFPLVLKPVVAGSKLNKVLIDGGSRLNVLFAKTLKKMGLDITHMLTKSTSPFYGIVPGNVAIPLGSVVLPHRVHQVRSRELRDFLPCHPRQTGYRQVHGGTPLHLLGTQDAKSSRCTLTARDLKISHDCDTEAVEIASTNQVPNTMMEIYAASKKLAPSELDIPKKSDKANKPQPPEEVLVKTIDLGTGDSSKTTTIGAGLDPK